MTEQVVVDTPHRCPFCKDSVVYTEPQNVCARCLTRHHVECWNELGHCSTFGCDCTEFLTHGESALPVSTQGADIDYPDGESDQLASEVRAEVNRRYERFGWIILMVMAAVVLVLALLKG